MARLLEVLIERGARGMNPNMVEGLEAAVPVIADEAARWFYQESEREEWPEQETFRVLAPPHEILWLEFKAPRFIRSEAYDDEVRPWPAGLWSHGGVLLTYSSMSAWKGEMAQFLGGRWPTAEWILQADVFEWWSETKFEPDVPLDVIDGMRARPAHVMTFLMGVDRDGKLSDPNLKGVQLMGGKPGTPPPPMMGVRSPAFPDLEPGTQAFGEVFGDARQPLRIALLSVYLMHSKGAELKDGARRGPVKKRRGKPRETPKIQYKVLDVGVPFRRSLDEARREGQGLERALRMHLRRGNFAVYTADKPHVSGHVGPMWRRPTVVGSKEKGEVRKTYRVRAKQKQKRKRKR